MDRRSAFHVGKEIGMSAARVNSIWKDMGIIIKDKFGDWVLTDAGRALGGRMSKNQYRPVPTFEYAVVKKAMTDFRNK